MFSFTFIACFSHSVKLFRPLVILRLFSKLFQHQRQTVGTLPCSFRLITLISTPYRGQIATTFASILRQFSNTRRTTFYGPKQYFFYNIRTVFEKQESFKNCSYFQKHDLFIEKEKQFENFLRRNFRKPVLILFKKINKNK